MYQTCHRSSENYIRLNLLVVFLVILFSQSLLALFNKTIRTGNEKISIDWDETDDLATAEQFLPPSHSYKLGQRSWRLCKRWYWNKKIKARPIGRHISAFLRWWKIKEIPREPADCYNDLCVSLVCADKSNPLWFSFLFY